ncbi:MAG: PQQ-binding-like beta-propeller repeat protein [Thermoleophilia bacterium]|nr:PQQ-binding-like beta-propeller repeat protein [Thermoleophilia bacterium]
MADRDTGSRLIAIVVAGQIIVTAAILGILFWTSRPDAAGPAEELLSPDSYFRSTAPPSEPTFRANTGRTGFYDSRAIREIGEVDTRLSAMSVSTAPVMADGIMYLCRGGNNLTAIEMLTGRELWQHKLLEWQASVPAVAGNTIYFGGESFFALDAKTGAEKWRFDAVSQGERGFVNAPVVVSDAVYVTLKGSLYALDALTGAKRWEYTIDGYGIETTAPAYSNGTLFFGAGSNNNGSGTQAIHAIDPATGREKWRYDLTGVVSSPPVAADGVVYFAATEASRTGGGDPRYPSQLKITSSLRALDALTGGELWLSETDRSILFPPAVAGGLLFFGDSQDLVHGQDSWGTLHALDAGTGKEVWKIDSIDTVSAPSIAEDWLYVSAAIPDPTASGVTGELGALLAIDARTGQQKWQYVFKQRYEIPAPIFYQDVMYVVPGGLLAFH